MVAAICKELVLRKEEQPEIIQTIYFGGGTPSLLPLQALEQIFETIYDYYEIGSSPEITLEANPDDLTPERINEFSNSPINRLSIGVQSFFEDDLKLLNRAHNASEANNCIEEVKKHFKNYSIDLIYGIPGMSNDRWLKNLDTAIQLNVPHLSCYALTVEPKTALKTFIDKGKIPPVDDTVAQSHHTLLLEVTENSGYENYEFSNFGKPGYFSQNNMAYWQCKSYLGVGPSAHSYNGDTRSWNVANNPKYIKSLLVGELPLERELLTTVDKYNEYVMTRLRTAQGILLNEIDVFFGVKYKKYVLQQLEPFIADELLFLVEGSVRVTKKGKFLSDGIAASLFLVNLEPNE